MDEEALVVGLKNKDEASFDLLYQSYSSVLYGVIYRMLKDEDEAQDLLQEVFVRIWDRIHQYDKSKGRLFTWMINLTRNFTVDRIRSADYKNHQLKNFVRDGRVPAIDAEYKDNQNIDIIGLKGILTKLDNDSKFIIQKLYFEGYTQADLAEEMQIPLGTLKTRLRTAIRKLRGFFD